MIKLDTNNGGHLEIQYNHEKHWTVVEKYDNNGNLEERYGIEDYDFVSMLNWFRYQKDNGNEALLFDGAEVGEVHCIRSFVEDGDEYFGVGGYYALIGKDNSGYRTVYRIKNNFNGVSVFDAEDFADYFVEEES